VRRRWSQVAGGVSILGDIQDQPDLVLGHQLWVVLLEQGFGPDDL